MEARFEIIDAFVDGERVDAAVLKRALSDPDGRDYFVDAWVLRESVQEEVAGDLATPSVPRRTRVVTTLLFAAALIVCLVGGYLVGYRASGRADATPGTTAPAQAVSATDAPVSSPVPAPTRVIQVKFGVDGSSTAGGGD